MSSGLRYKFQGSHISIQTEFAADSPAQAITGITQADPPVVTSTGHGLANGDVVYITDVVGMIEVNERPFIVDGVTSSTFKLFSTDSTGYAAYVSGGSFSASNWSEFCEVKNWNRTGASKSQNDVSTVCSDEQEFESGLPGPGSLALTFNYAGDTSTAQIALHAWDASSEKFGIKRELPKNGGTRVYLGSVQQMSDTGGVNGVWEASSTIQLSGPHYTVPA
jgi:hypothetical protein